MRAMRIKRLVVWVFLASLFMLLYELFSWFKSSKDTQILIAVVEEHHEVLNYWFEAAEDETLPRKGIHMIHIDGHSDEAQPEYNPHIPFFKRPESLDQVDTMMQRNDMFIQISAMVGFLTSFLWIYPSWLEEDEPLTRSRVDLGYFNTTVNHNKTTVFCECRTFHDNGEKNCFFMNFEKNSQEIPMTVEKCQMKGGYESNSINELMLIESGKAGESDEKDIEDAAPAQQYSHGGLRFSSKGEENTNLIPPNVPVIWDIDLDYFGCEMPGQILVDAGFTWRVVELLDSKLELLFCPQNMRHERLADTLLKNLLLEMMKSCQLNDVNKHCKLPFNEILERTSRMIVASWKESPTLFCARNDLQLRNRWKNIVFALYHLKFSQVKALLEVGFCFISSPKTFGILDVLSVQICHGVNPPDTKLIQLYKTSYDDVQERLKRLEKIFSILPTPQLVTICRSSRDGYVPRRFMKEIELGVINAIKKAKGTVKFHTFYDHDLLGGEEGINARYKVKM